jgi:hypothetical protein
MIPQRQAAFNNHIRIASHFASRGIATISTSGLPERETTRDTAVADGAVAGFDQGAGNDAHGFVVGRFGYDDVDVDYGLGVEVGD